MTSCLWEDPHGWRHDPHCKISCLFPPKLYRILNSAQSMESKTLTLGLKQKLHEINK